MHRRRTHCPIAEMIAMCRPLGIRQKRGNQTAVGQKIYSSTLTSKSKLPEVTKYLCGTEVTKYLCGNKR